MSTEAIGQKYQSAETEVKNYAHKYIKEAVLALWKGERLQGQYITASALSQLIKKRYKFENELDFEVKALNIAMT